MLGIALTVGGVVVGGMVALKLYLIWRSGKCTSKADLTGKTTLVTGANVGIGYYTALDFARRNARVILVCRNQQKGQSAVDSIKQKTGNQNVLLYIADLSLMSSVRELAETILKNEPKLHILVNNAGVAGIPFTKTDEGLEMIYATNHYSPFLLTNLLLDLIKKSAPSRIVNVSSIGHRLYPLDPNRMTKDEDFHPFSQYCQTKLCNVLFTRELAARLDGTGVTTYVVHPGAVNTAIWRHLGPVLGILIGFFRIVYMKSSEEGAQTSIYCAVSEELEGVTGKYYSDCREAENKASESSKDMGLAKKVWEISERVTGLAS